MDVHMPSRKSIVVTGSSSGIGAETSALLRSKGVRVIGFDKVAPEFENTDQFISVDLADPAAIDKAVSQVSDKVDGLCNVAGVPPTLPEALVLKVNFTGLRYLTEALIDHMNDGASIVNVASMAGFGWQQNLEQVKALLALREFGEITSFVAEQDLQGAKSYMVSKQALLAWTHKNWDTWKDRSIRMNAVSPGPADTPILKDFVKSLGKRAEEDLGKLRAGTVSEIAPVIAFLCGDDSRWVRGVNIPADGGLAASALCEIHKL